MRIAVIGGSLVASLLLVTVVVGLLPSVGFAQRPGLPATTSGGGELISFSVPIEDHRQQVTLIDTAKRVMSVYHIDTSSGEISLKSVRNVFWDLQMVEFNGTSPLPREIRSLLDQK
jgi:hypothetical protein